MNILCDLFRASNSASDGLGVVGECLKSTSMEGELKDRFCGVTGSEMFVPVCGACFGDLAGDEFASIDSPSWDVARFPGSDLPVLY